MGLAVAAYAKVELVASDVVGDPIYDVINAFQETGVETISIRSNIDFPERTAPLIVPANGINLYSSLGEVLYFYVGGYGYYNRFREWLCETMGLPQPREQWAMPLLHAKVPFHELVNFTDSDGVIGGEASARLAVAFAEHQDQIGRIVTQNYSVIYHKFRKAFELAAGSGAVIFC